MTRRDLSRRRFLGGTLAATAGRLLSRVSFIPPLFTGAAMAVQRGGIGPRELEVGFNWNRFLSLHTHLRRLSRSQEEPPQHYADVTEVYRRHNFLVPGLDIWFSMERYIARCRDVPMLRSQLSKLFPLEYRSLNLAPTGLAVSAALARAMPTFEKEDWPALERRRRESVDPAVKEQFQPMRQKLLQFLFTSLNAEPLSLRRIKIDLVGRYIQTGYRTRKINGAYFTIVETDRFRGLALIESVLLMLGRIIELEDRGNAKGALFLLRERQESLHFPNPALLPRAVLYWTAGEAVRRILDPGHEHVGKQLQIYQRAFRPFIPALEEYWNAYLSGQLGLDEALGGLIRQASGQA